MRAFPDPFGEIDLKGVKVWLSGAVPEPEESPLPRSPTDPSVEVRRGSAAETSILEFVRAFACMVFKFGGQLIHGSHPSLTTILLEQARRYLRDRPGPSPLMLAASDFFSTEENEQDWRRWQKIARVHITPKTGTRPEDRDASLAVLRKFMAQQCTAFVAIGGKWWDKVPGRAGVPKELALAKQQRVPAYVLGGFGGVSSQYAHEQPGWYLGLNNSLSAEDNQRLASLRDVNLAAGWTISQLNRAAISPHHFSRATTMTNISVNFRLFTGLKQSVFRNVRLCGSWDGQRRYSSQWSTSPMQEYRAHDGCPAFVGQIDFSGEQTGWTFHWGVVVDTDTAQNVWGIMSEVKDVNSTQRERSFILRAPVAGGSAQEEACYFTQCRRMGAQPVEQAPESGVRFSVWAPNAQKVEVVFGYIWENGHPGTPQQGSLPVSQIMGGYIANDGTGQRPGYQPVNMQLAGEGVWMSDVLVPFSKFDHMPYMYRVTKDNGHVEYRTDLYSRCQIGVGTFNPCGGAYTGQLVNLNGMVSCSAVINPDTVTQYFEELVQTGNRQEAQYPEKHFISADEFWNKATFEKDGQHLVTSKEFDARRPVPRRVEDLVIYELHLGALGFHENSADNPNGTLEDAVRFLDYLTDPQQGLGINAIELLPLSEFGDAASNWGYSTSHYCAIEYAGGGRDKYKFFIKACHQRGLAVIMDVVYNHYNHSAERAEWMYDTDAHEKNPYYWYEGLPNDYPAFEHAAAIANPQDPQAPKPGHGGYLDNLSTNYAPRYHEEMVRQMFVSSAAALVEEFHVDGFRVDQTTSIHSYNRRHADGAPVAAANTFGAKLLKEWTRTMRLINPEIMLMAEDYSDRHDVVMQSPDAGGLGFDAFWYADYHHNLVGRNYGANYARLIPTAGSGGDGPLAIDYFAGALEYSGHQTVVYHTNHDEAGNADRDKEPGRRTHRTIVDAVNEVLNPSTRRYAEARCRFAFGVTVFSAGTPLFLFGEEVGFQNDFLYDNVAKLREDFLAHRNDDRGQYLFRFYRQAIRTRLANAGLRSRNIRVLHVHNVNRVLAFKRWGSGQEFLVLASLNNAPFNRPNYSIQHGEIPDGNWHEIFNSDAADYRGDNVGNYGGTLTSRGGWFSAVIPANGLVVFQRV